jgi:hypothetical protein
MESEMAYTALRELGGSQEAHGPANGWAEHRKSERRLTLKTGRIVVENDAYSLECAILNVSDHGACVLVPLGAVTGDRFTLFVDGSDEARFCAVAWREGSRIGVSYD